jgi:hypothetical protein
MDARDHAAMTGGNRTPTVLVEEYDDAGEHVADVETPLPVKLEVCGLCQGRGSHVNPSVDAHGLSGEDFAEDPDFAEDYLSGRYDQTCNECHGLRVVEAVDREACPPELLALYDRQQQDLAEMYAIEAAERRMGA